MYLYMYIIQGDDEMKTMKILYKIMWIVALIIMSTSGICYADQELPDLHDGGGEGIITGENLPNLDSGYKPTADFGKDGKAITVIVTILAVLRTLGIITTIIGIALIGFNSILGSASEKAINQEKYVGIVIAAIIIVGASTIVKFIMNFAHNI